MNSGQEMSNRIKRAEDGRERRKRRSATSREREENEKGERGRHLKEVSRAGWLEEGGVSAVESSCRLA